MGNKNTDTETYEEDDYQTISLTLDNGRELECRVVAQFSAGGNDYIALLPDEFPEDLVYDDGEPYDAGEVFLYRFHEEDGEPVLDLIDTDEEFEVASDAFDEILDTMEYDEFVGEEFLPEED
ncbi:MAG: DUF1292 domain-containing protein [Lachnospiraceae bacterium]|nr:DUF1292 domain-containing protein [Lachnospiraceae bacterium]